MNPKTIRILLATAVFLLNLPAAPAADLAISSLPEASSNTAPAAKLAAESAQKKGYYLTGKEEVFAAFPAAPKLNSQPDHTDLLITLALQGSRTSGQIEESKRDANYGDAIKAMIHMADPDFETTFPETSEVAQLLKHAADDGGLINRMLKARNARSRPFIQHPGLVTPLFPVPDFSYPSGHASGSELLARILSELFPENADAIMNKAKLIADSRVVAGVHYESDVEAGAQLGDLIFSTLKANPKFARDLNAAKASLSKKQEPANAR